MPASASVAAWSWGCWNRPAVSPGKVLSCRFFFASAIAGILARVHVAKREDVGEMAFVAARETAVRRKLVRILVRPEQSIPHRQIGKVVAMHVQLVMHRVQL